VSACRPELADIARSPLGRAIALRKIISLPRLKDHHARQECYEAQTELVCQGLGLFAKLDKFASSIAVCHGTLPKDAAVKMPPATRTTVSLRALLARDTPAGSAIEGI
jgi:hypothetical protein